MSVLLRAMLKKQLLEMTAFLRRNAATGRSRTGWRVIGFGALMVLVLLCMSITNQFGDEEKEVAL